MLELKVFQRTVFKIRLARILYKIVRLRKRHLLQKVFIRSATTVIAPLILKKCGD
jgi:hypothetical protein